MAAAACAFSVVSVRVETLPIQKGGVIIAMKYQKAAVAPSKRNIWAMMKARDLEVSPEDDVYVYVT